MAIFNFYKILFIIVLSLRQILLCRNDKYVLLILKQIASLALAMTINKENKSDPFIERDQDLFYFNSLLAC